MPTAGKTEYISKFSSRKKVNRFADYNNCYYIPATLKKQKNKQKSANDKLAPVCKNVSVFVFFVAMYLFH